MATCDLYEYIVYDKKNDEITLMVPPLLALLQTLDEQYMVLGKFG